MTLSRRAVLFSPFALLPALSGMAQAGACPLLDLDKGIVFTRADGSRGLARREGDGSVAIDYVTNRGAWVDRRRVRNGVFEVQRVVQESEEVLIGASIPEYTWTHGRKTVDPAVGVTWQGTVKEVVEVIISDEKGTVQRERDRWQASYRCFDPRAVSLSGCVHDALSVEAEFTNPDGKLRTQRWVYFPRFGLGLETQRNGVSNGIVAMGPA